MGYVFFGIGILYMIWWWFVIFRNPNDPDNPKRKDIR